MNERSIEQRQRTVEAVSNGLLQRKCDCGQHTVAGGECDECGRKHVTLQRAHRNSELRTLNSGGAPPIVHDVVRSSGQPLDASTRAFFEPRFSHDFSRVRVHTDAKAAESARAVNALAYTVGKEIVFGSGQYLPGTSVGNRLLAHELTHVIQQADGSPGRGFGRAADAHEREADNSASMILEGRNVGVQPAPAAPSVQRQDSPENLGLVEPSLRLGTRRQPSLFRPGEEPQLHLDTDSVHVPVTQPAGQTLTNNQTQQIAQQPLPDRVAVPGQRSPRFERVGQEPTQLGVDLSLDSSANFQLSFVARHWNVSTFKVFGSGPIDFIHEPAANVLVSLNPPVSWGSLGAQVSTTLFNYHIQQHGQDFIELGLGQLGFGFDGSGNLIASAGLSAEVHTVNPHFSLVFSTGGTLTRTPGGGVSTTWNPVSLTLLVHWKNP